MSHAPGSARRPSVEPHAAAELTRESIPLRLGLICAGLLAFFTALVIWLQVQEFWRPAILALSGAAWIVGAICLVLAMARRVRTSLQWLVLAVLIGSLWGMALIQWQNTGPYRVAHTDNEMIGEYSAEALKQGYNPYSWNFSDAARVYRDQAVLSTAFLDGSRQNRVAYPALPTLLLWALASIGLGQVRLVSLMIHSVLVVLLFVSAPARMRPLIALPLFGIRQYLFLTLGGIQDIAWSTLLVGMLLAWKRPALRAILFGLACAYRQQPWLLAPFLLIHLWNEQADQGGRRARIRYFVGVSLGTFLVINLPFLVWDARGWVLAVFEHTYAAFNVTSHGLGAVSQYGLLSLPRNFFTFLQLSLLGLMITVHWRHSRWVGMSFWIFPAIFFWAFYRSLANYWLYWIPPLLVALIRHDWSDDRLIEPARRWRQTMYFIAATLAANLLLAAWFLSRPPAITASISYPLQSGDGYSVFRLSLGVANHSDRVFHPRFAVQHDGSQPLPWDIEMGPEALKPGEAATFVISTYARTFSIAKGGQLVVSDAGGDYTLRAVKDIAGQRAFASPDLIVNPAFTVWQSYAQVPAGWTWDPPDDNSPPLRTELVGQQNALVIAVDQGSARLSQIITFPESFSILVYPSGGGTDPGISGCGLELDDGQHELRVLFGDAEKHGLLEENVGYVYRRAALNQWSDQVINPAELYALLGWELPPYRVRNSQGIEFSARQLKLSLLVFGSKVEGIFGPLAQDSDFVMPEALAAAAIEHPDVYYVNLGNEYRRQRNFDLAEDAFRQAVAYNASNASAHNGLGRTLADQGRCVEAQQQLDVAARLDPGIQDPFGGIMMCR